MRLGALTKRWVAAELLNCWLRLENLALRLRLAWVRWANRKKLPGHRPLEVRRETLEGSVSAGWTLFRNRVTGELTRARLLEGEGNVLGQDGVVRPFVAGDYLESPFNGGPRRPIRQADFQKEWEPYVVW